MTRVVEPAVADLQLEYTNARNVGRIWASQWIRIAGSFAVLKVLLQLVWRETWWTVTHPTDDDRRRRFQLLAWTALMFVVITYVLAGQPHFNVRRHLPADQLWLVVTLIPQALPISIPAAIVLGLAAAIGSGKLSRHVSAAILTMALTGTFVSFVVLAWLVPVANQTFREAMFALASPSDGSRIPKGTNELTLGELRAAVRPAYPHDARHAARRAFSYYIRFALPCAPLVLTLVMVSTRLGRSSRVWRRIAGGLGVIVAYYSLMAIGEASTLGGTMPAMVGAWLPHMTLTALVLALPSLRQRSAST